MILTCLGKEVQENQQTYIQMQLMLPVLYEDPKKGKQKHDKYENVQQKKLNKLAHKKGENPWSNMLHVWLH